MKFVKANFEILPIPDPYDKMAVYQHLERVGRVCYKSEDKITDDSCLKFLTNIRNRKHWAMLEHYIFVISVSEEMYNDFLENYEVVDDEDPDIGSKLRFVRTSINDRYYDTSNKFLISGSATAFNYLWACKFFSTVDETDTVNMIGSFLHQRYPEIIMVPEHAKEYADTPIEDRVGKIHLLSRKEIEALPVGSRLIHDFASVKSITDRGVTHEDVRHRPASWAQESTRYCNYGKLGCTFIIPCWFTDEESNILINMTDNEFYRHVNTLSQPDRMSLAAWRWAADMMYLGSEYEKFVKPLEDKSESSAEGIEIFGDDGYGWTPQQARSILPNSVKTEIIMTAPLDEWVHYFNMRVPTSAHPQMRELAVPMLSEFAERDPSVFLEQKKRLIEEA